MVKYFGITGFGRVGKDTFVELSKKHLKEKYNINSIRLAFADDLKKDLAGLIAESFGLDIFGLTNKEKEIIRPLMVEYGSIARQLSKGKFWINRLEEKIKNNKIEKNYQVVFISDVRFQEFEGDEVDWVVSKGGSVIGVAKFNEEGVSIDESNPRKGVWLTEFKSFLNYGNDFNKRPVRVFSPPANITEKLAGSKIYQKHCSNILIWPDVNNQSDLLIPIVEDFWEKNKHLIHYND